MAFVSVNRLFYPVRMMCNALGLCPSRYYCWRKGILSPQKEDNEHLAKKVAAIFEDSRKTYGSLRITAQLKKDGEKCGRNRVRRIMKAKNIAPKYKRKFKSTTDSKHDLPVAANILQRKFDPMSKDVAWVQDITYISTQEGFLYLAVVIDLFSRKVIGWSLQNNMRKELVIDAFDMALKARNPKAGLIAHSDRGSQYCSHLFQAKLAGNGVVCSMSRKAECWDNAVAESFFHTLKTELVYLEKYETNDSARRSIFEYIEVFYNRKRLHSKLGFCSPLEYEKDQEKVA